MFSKALSLVVVVFLAASAARADWTVAESARHAGREGLVTRVEVMAENSGTSESARLQFAIFDAKKATLRIFDQPSEQRSSLAATMRSNDCLAGVNGGYFDPNYAPVGLLISEKIEKS